MGQNIPLDSILPACRNHILFISAFTVLDGLDVDGGLPASQHCALLLLVVRIEEDKFIWVKENGVLECIPSILLETGVIAGQYFVVIGPLCLFLSFKAISPDLT